MAGVIYSSRRILPVYIGWWLFWATLQLFVLHRLGIQWNVAALDAFISNGLLSLICSGALLIFSFWQPNAGSRFYRFFRGLSITLIYMIIMHWALRLSFSGDPHYQAFLTMSMPVRFMFSLLMVSFLMLVNWLWNNQQEQQEQSKRKTEAEQLVKEAELVKLRQQLQPHFLFNSLNSISALAGARPDEARKMIQQLSDFLRGTLKKDEQQVVALQEELDHLKLYLDIEKVRFGHRLNVELNIQEESTQFLLPPLLLQPIVENAIKFGLYGTIDKITVGIRTYTEGGMLHIEVKNPYDEQTQNVKQGTGFGLSSIQRRLSLLYSRTDLLSTERKESIFYTRLKIPQIK